MQNYTSLMAVIAGLNCSPILRLKYTKAGLPKKISKAHQTHHTQKKSLLTMGNRCWSSWWWWWALKPITNVTEQCITMPALHSSLSCEFIIVCGAKYSGNDSHFWCRGLILSDLTFIDGMFHRLCFLTHKFSKTHNSMNFGRHNTQFIDLFFFVLCRWQPRPVWRIDQLHQTQASGDHHSSSPTLPTIPIQFHSSSTDPQLHQKWQSDGWQWNVQNIFGTWTQGSCTEWHCIAMMRWCCCYCCVDVLLFHVISKNVIHHDFLLLAGKTWLEVIGVGLQHGWPWHQHYSHHNSHSH